MNNWNGVAKHLERIEAKIKPAKIEIEQDGDAIVIRWDNKIVKKLLRKFFDAL